MSDKPCSSVLFSDPISVRTKVTVYRNFACYLILVTDRRTSKMTGRRGRTMPLSEVLELITQSGSDDEGSLDEVCVTAEYVLNRM